MPNKINTKIQVESPNKAETRVIIAPAKIFAGITHKHVCQKLRPKTTAKQVPVQTPVSGKGIATKIKTLKNFIQNAFLFFLS